AAQTEKVSERPSGVVSGKVSGKTSEKPSEKLSGKVSVWSSAPEPVDSQPGPGAGCSPAAEPARKGSQ
ncbi:hypothetical protein, partial [Paenibacillus sonchi]